MVSAIPTWASRVAVARRTVGRSAAEATSPTPAAVRPAPDIAPGDASAAQTAKPASAAAAAPAASSRHPATVPSHATPIPKHAAVAGFAASV